MKILASEADWEVVDDDGFVYKRARREPAVEEVVVEEDEEEEEDGELEETESLEQRRDFLLKKKEIYATELKIWEELLSRQEELNAAAVPPSLPSAATQSPAIMLGEPHYEPYEELLQQVQDLEFFIRKYTSFCEQAEDLCLLLDEELKNHNLQLLDHRQIFQELTYSTPSSSQEV